MIKLSFSTLGCPQYTLDQVISTAIRSGYDGVELRFLRGQVDLETLEEFTPSGIRRTRELFERHGVAVSCVDTSVRFTSSDPVERAKHQEAAKVYARIAAELGAPYIRLFGGAVPETSPEHEQTTRLIAEGLAEAAATTAAEGVMAVLETHDSFCTAAQVKELLSYAPNDDLGILWDVLHSYRHGEPLEETWRELGDRIRHVHLKDADDLSPTSFQPKLAGHGAVPLADAVDLLRRAAYDGYISFEWEKAWHPDIEEPEVAIPQFAAYLRPLLDRPAR